MSSEMNLLLQTLYVIVNVATGSLKHKECILNSKVLTEHLYKYLGHRDSGIKVATIWAIINLTWQDADVMVPMDVLHEMGFASRLRELLNDGDADVRGRAKTCLEHFEH